MKVIRFSILLLSGLLLNSCVKDRPEMSNKPADAQITDSAKVFVVNEGNYGSSNASISLFNRLSGKLTEDIFKTVNESNLGDVAQSLYHYGNFFYIVVNNSGKILICDDNFKLQASITGLSSPRYMTFLNNKAYVSDFKAGEIHVLDLHTKSKIGKIPCAGWTEDVLLHKGKLYVSNPFKNYVYVVDTGKDQIEDSIWVGQNVSGLQTDINGKLWILSAGKSGTYPPKLLRADPESLELELQLSFPEQDFPFKLCTNGNKDTLYFINKNVYAFGIKSNTLPAAALVEAGTRNFYGMGVHPHTSDLYLSDALDFSQRSHISVYASNGNLRGEFKAGINANGFYFD